MSSNSVDLIFKLDNKQDGPESIKRIIVGSTKYQGYSKDNGDTFITNHNDFFVYNVGQFLIISLNTDEFLTIDGGPNMKYLKSVYNAIALVSTCANPLWGRFLFEDVGDDEEYFNKLDPLSDANIVYLSSEYLAHEYPQCAKFVTDNASREYENGYLVTSLNNQWENATGSMIIKEIQRKYPKPFDKSEQS